VWLQRTCGGAIPQVPEGVRIYAVGDVHGRADLLQQKLSRVDADLATYPHCTSLQIFLGDYIDRGPYSRAVLDLLISRALNQHCAGHRLAPFSNS
jgi:serine/threonine protein phosphatase 1